MTRYRVGCTGWGYDDWRGGFYPPGTPAGDYLHRYAKVFRATEVDSTYYQAPSPQQTARWADATPDGFLFTAKFPGAITHKAQLRNVEQQVDEFLFALGPLRRAEKLGPLVLQFPASFDRPRHEHALAAFLESWRAPPRLAVELRHPSWWRDETYRMLERANAALVWGTTEVGRAPPVVTADFVYARIIGDRALTRFDRIQRDESAELRHWAERFENEGRLARDAYVFVNNHLMGFAPATASMLHEILGLPKPDLSAAMRDEGQQRLF